MGKLIVDNMPYTFLYIRAVYNGATFWLPSILLVLGIAMPLWRRRRSKLDIKNGKGFVAKIADRLTSRSTSLFCVLLALLVFGLRYYATHFEPHNLKIKRITIESTKIHDPIRIVHLSDIQSLAIGPYEERVFDLVRRENPDLLIHTGDLLQPGNRKQLRTEVANIARLMASVEPPMGKFGVYGDTDGIMHDESPESLGGLRYLESEQILLKKGDSGINLFALAFREAQVGPKEKIANWVDSASPEHFKLLIGHSPDYILEVSDNPIDLCLAGHTHGGQIRLPIIGPLVTCSRIPRKLARGFHRVNRTMLNTSAGIGCERCFRVPKIRFLCPPEFTVIDLQPARL